MEFTELLRTKPYLVGFISGFVAQAIKVVSFIILEKRVNFRRFVETDGSPNMHSAAFTGLGVYVGVLEGFDSLLFGLVFCFTALVYVDIWNVKRATSRHAELIDLIMDRVQRVSDGDRRPRKVLSYTPIDVFSGGVLGLIVALLVA